MAVSRPRSRIVSFRVSQEAFDRLSVLRESDDGPRSLSELTRLAVEALLRTEQGPAQPNMHQVLYRVDQVVSEVEKKVDRLLELLAPAEPASEGANNGHARDALETVASAPLTHAAAAGGKLLAAVGALVLTMSAAFAQQAPAPPAPPLPGTAAQSVDDTDRLRRNYVLGTNDEIMVRAPESEELNGKAFRVDADGNIHLPLLGAVPAGGSTVQQLESEIARKLSAYYRSPSVRLTIIQFRSDPVFFVGAFKSPGIYPLQGNRRLLDMLTLVGGLDATAGRRIRITRRLEAGRIPLRSAVEDQGRRMSVVEVSITRLMETVNPEENIELKAHDIVRVGVQEMVYVSGEVGRVGGLPLMDKDSLSILQALALSGGLAATAAPEKARILRPILDTNRRAEIPVNIKAILNGQAYDVPLVPNDMLVVPRRGGSRNVFNRFALVAVTPLVTSLVWLAVR